MMVLSPKGPDEIKFYDFDWAAKRLAPGETITDFGWEIAGGSVEIASNPAPSVTSGVCRVYLQGGELGDECSLTNWVVTNLNPRRDFTAKLKVKTVSS